MLSSSETCTSQMTATLRPQAAWASSRPGHGEDQPRLTEVKDTSPCSSAHEWQGQVWNPGVHSSPHPLLTSRHIIQDDDLQLEARGPRGEQRFYTALQGCRGSGKQGQWTECWMPGLHPGQGINQGKALPFWRHSRTPIQGPCRASPGLPQRGNPILLLSLLGPHLPARCQAAWSPA